MGIGVDNGRRNKLGCCMEATVLHLSSASVSLYLRASPPNGLPLAQRSLLGVFGRGDPHCFARSLSHRAGIHHKTSETGEHGYPDDSYLDRVTSELRDFGVTEADIP